MQKRVRSLVPKVDAEFTAAISIDVPLPGGFHEQSSAIRHVRQVAGEITSVARSVTEQIQIDRPIGGRNLQHLH